MKNRGEGDTEATSIVFDKYLLEKLRRIALMQRCDLSKVVNFCCRKVALRDSEYWYHLTQDTGRKAKMYNIMLLESQEAEMDNKYVDIQTQKDLKTVLPEK